MSKFFPIKQDPACLLKWSQSSLYLWENTASSCHRNLNATIPDNFDFHNTDITLEHRTKMLNGQWPADGRGCEHCRDQELAGGISDRLQWINNDYNERYVPKEIIANPKEVRIAPTQVSVHFNNKCNLKCVYCGPNQSSSWVMEQWRYDEGKNYEFDPWLQDKTYKQRLAKFYGWMEQNYSKLKAFDILGGEPFIQTETFDCIDWMIQHPNPDCDIEIYSNFQIKPELFKRGMEKIRQLAGTVNEVLIVASIDCFGPESEYIRFGHDWVTFEENWNYLLHQCPEIKPTMNWTVSSLSIPYTVPLVKKVIKWQQVRNVSVNYNKCVDPVIYDPHIMPPSTFTKYFDELLELNKTMYSGNTLYQDYVKGIFMEIDTSPAQPNIIKELKATLTKLDQRRGTNWRETFPWLESVPS